jgi:Type II secretion system protein C
MTNFRSLKEFLKSLKELLQRDFQLKDLVGLPKYLKNLGNLRSRNFSQENNFGPSKLDVFLQKLQPIKFAGFIRNFLILMSVLMVCFTFLQIFKILLKDQNTRPAEIYRLEDIHKSFTFFGQKDFDISSIKVTGIMLGNKPSNSFAIMEVRGNSTGAVSIGEAFDNGYFLKEITENQVVVIYQGKRYTISKPDTP